MKTTFLLIHLLFFCVNAQTRNINVLPDSSDISTIFLNDIVKSGNNELQFFNNIVGFNNNDLLKLSAVSAITGLMFIGDETVRNNVNSNYSQYSNGIIKYGDYYGRVFNAIGLGTGLYLGGLLFDENKIKETGSTLMEALLASGVTVTLLKVILGRARPYNNQGQYSFHFFEINNSFNSLASGHTIVAFTTSAVLADRFDNIYASIGLYSLAVLTAYQRVYSDNHWLSDTFLGAVMGIAIGKYFSNLNQKNNEENISKLELNIYPFISNNQSGLGIKLKF